MQAGDLEEGNTTEQTGEWTEQRTGENIQHKTKKEEGATSVICT